MRSNPVTGRATMWWLAGILLAGGLARLVWILFTIHQPVGLTDPAFYFTSAIDISQGHGYVRAGVPTAYFPPAWPFALAGLYWVLFHTPLPDDLPAFGLGLNLVLGVASVWLVYLLGARLFDRRVGLVTAGLLALCPSLVFYTGTFFSETLFVFFELAALAVLASGRYVSQRWSAGRLVAFGVLVGLAALTRAVGLVMLLALFGAVWLAGAGPRAALTQSAIAVAAAALVIAPWTVRNLVVMDSAVPIATNTGEDLCIGHNPLATGAFLINDYCHGPLPQPPDKAEVASEHRGIKNAWHYARHHPRREVELLWHRSRYTYENDSDALIAIENYGYGPFIRDDIRGVLETMANVFFFAVALLGLAGLGAFARRDAGRLLVGLTLFGLALVPLITFGNPRFHIPMIPLLALSAAALVTALARRSGGRSGARASATAPGQAG